MNVTEDTINCEHKFLERPTERCVGCHMPDFDEAEFDRGYVCAVATILRTHDDTVIARDVLRANEPANWSAIDSSDRDVIDASGIRSNTATAPQGKEGE